MSDCIWDLEYWLNLDIYKHPPCMFTLWYLGLFANAIIPPIKEFIENLTGGGEDGDDGKKKEGDDGGEDKDDGEEDQKDDGGEDKKDDGGDEDGGDGNDGGEEEEEEQEEA